MAVFPVAMTVFGTPPKSLENEKSRAEPFAPRGTRDESYFRPVRRPAVIPACPDSSVRRLRGGNGLVARARIRPTLLEQLPTPAPPRSRLMACTSCPSLRHDLPLPPAAAENRYLAWAALDIETGCVFTTLAVLVVASAGAGDSATTTAPQQAAGRLTTV